MFTSVPIHAHEVRGRQLQPGELGCCIRSVKGKGICIYMQGQGFSLLLFGHPQEPLLTAKLLAHVEKTPPPMRFFLEQHLGGRGWNRRGLWPGRVTLGVVIQYMPYGPIVCTMYRPFTKTIVGNLK